MTARNFQGQFSTWPGTLFIIVCALLIAAMLDG